MPRENFNPKLPLWSLVVFVDWHGVLSRDPFWASITDSSDHRARDRVRRRLKDEIRKIFENRKIVDSWMRGQLNSKEVVAGVRVNLDRRFRESFLERRLLEDCRWMRVNSSLMQILRTASTRAFIVIATDNMDCFYEQASLVRAVHRIKSRANTHFLKDAIWYFDEVLCSSSIGTLKAEKPNAFFGPWLEYHRLGFQHALLLDDAETNCTAFRKAGGTAIRTLKNDFDEGFTRVGPMIMEWLDHASAKLSHAEMRSKGL